MNKKNDQKEAVVVAATAAYDIYSRCPTSAITSDTSGTTTTNNNTSDVDVEEGHGGISAKASQHHEQEIARLKSELNTVKIERDLLIVEVSKLKFELEIADNTKKQYTMRAATGRSLSSYMNGSINHSPDCHHDDCDDTEEANSDIDDIIAGEDFNDNNNYKSTSATDSYHYHQPYPHQHQYQYQWHRPTSHNSSIRQNSSELVNYSRPDVMSYELSQDLLEKQIELLERKYGGTRAREAAIAIQRAFRRYQLIKKFAHITEMVKAEKGLSRRFQPNENAAVHVNEYTCEAKTSAGLQANLTPIRSLSMRERRLAELESGSNSLPRTYVGRCISCTYCCSVTNACSPCCMAVTPPINLCPTYYIKQNHSISGDIMRNYQQPHSANCSSTSPSAFVSYPSPVMSSGGHRKYSGQYIYQNTSSLSYQMNSSCTSSRSQISTPKKVPPEVPKRTSSISFKSSDGKECLLSGPELDFSQAKYSGSMSSVQSSSSDSSSTMNASHSSSLNVTNCSAGTTTTWNKKPQVTETVRKRQYRVGLNLFNKKPEKGVAYLVEKGFLEDTPQATAKFLIHRKGLSKKTIGEYLGDRNQYNQAVLECYMNEIDLSGMQVDVALRKFVTYFKLPGEAQKIERLMKSFSDRYCRCNRDVVARFQDPDTVFVLAFAIIMLNSDQHTRSMKDEHRMKLDDFITNLRRVVGYDINEDMLVGIYERVKANEFKDGNDHVSQVRKVETTIVGLKMMLALPHRRLVCYCRLYQVTDVNKKEKTGVHQREVFLFNDLLVITKILSKKKNAVTYTFRQNFSLSGLHVSMFENQYYQYGIQLMQRVDNQVLITFNARNDHDRTKFVEDIRESIMEMDEMENIRIEAELERQKSSRTNRCSTGNNTENRDSGVADVEVCQCLHGYPPPPSTNVEHDPKLHSANEQQPSTTLKRSILSNSLLDIHDQDERPQRSGSVGSLDSGMSISFRSSSSLSRKHNPNAKRSPNMKVGNVSSATASTTRNQAFLANFFSKGSSKSPSTDE